MTAIIISYLLVGIFSQVWLRMFGQKIFAPTPEILSQQERDKIENELKKELESNPVFSTVQFVIGIVVILLWPVTMFITLRYAISKS